MCMLSQIIVSNDSLTSLFVDSQPDLGIWSYREGMVAGFHTFKQYSRSSTPNSKCDNVKCVFALFFLIAIFKSCLRQPNKHAVCLAGYPVLSHSTGSSNTKYRPHTHKHILSLSYTHPCLHILRKMCMCVCIVGGGAWKREQKAQSLHYHTE